MLAVGSSGPEVSMIQQFLNEQSGGYGLAVDGIFGPLTEQEVKNFQVRMGLVPDGIVGPNTMQAMTNLGFVAGC